MLKERLDRVNAILVRLIALTEEDLENIKVARHEGVASSIDKKNGLIAEFVAAKKRLDLSLVELNNGSVGGLSQALDSEDKDKLDTLKRNLQVLHEKNKEYAKLVLIVKDFLDGLVDKMFGTCYSGIDNSYTSKKTLPESIFKINA